MGEERTSPAAGTHSAPCGCLTGPVLPNGGLSSPADSCVWHVVGLQRSVREWAIRQGWGGRPVRQEQAQGILVAALGMLAAHFEYGAAKRAS